MLPLFEKAHKLRLTETEKNILAYFEEHAASVLHMTLSDLCGVLYTSNATIVRFCQKLGLSGYNDLKYQIRSGLQAQQETVFYPDAYISRILARLQDTIAALDLGQLEEIAGLLTSGRPLYIYGTNLSALPARYLQIVLNSLDYPSILIEWEELLHGLTGNIHKDSVLLIMTAKGNPDHYLRTFQLAKERGLTTVLLTAGHGSPLVSYSTIAVFTNDWNEEFQNMDMDPRIGFFTVVQILIELIASRTDRPADP